jgi:peptidoglycan/LPS O-acetylase OafA/YrhL
MDALAIGALIALVMRRPKPYRALVRWAWAPALVSMVGLVCLVFYRGQFAIEDILIGSVGLSMLAVLMGAVLILAVGRPAHGLLERLLSWAPLRFLGRYSYGLYVLHHPISILLPRAGLTIAAFPEWMGSQMPGFVFFGLAAGGLSIGLALLSWHLWESRFQGLRDRVA